MLNRLRAFFSSPTSPTSPISALGGSSTKSGRNSRAAALHGMSLAMSAYCAITLASASLEDDHCIDGFGVKTLYECVPFTSPDSLNLARLQHPIPDDGFHAEGIEYIALLDAVERFANDGSFVAVEAGAVGPWLAMAGVVTAVRGKDTQLIGIGLTRAVCSHAPASWL